MTLNQDTRARAEAALTELTEAVAAEIVEAGGTGMRNDEVARALGLETSVNGGQRNHLTHALLNRLVEQGRLERDKRGSRIYYRKP